MSKRFDSKEYYAKNKDLPKLCQNCSSYLSKEMVEELDGGMCECCEKVYIKWVRKEKKVIP